MIRRRAMMAAKEQGGDRLPSAYQEVEWVGIPSKNGAYIDTGVACSATTIRMVAKYVHLGSSDCYGVATRKGDGSTTQYSFFGYYSWKSQFAWGSYFYGPACSPNTVYEADATFKNRDQQIVLNGVSGSSSKVANANGTGTFYIFGRNNDGTLGNQPAGMNFYYLQIYMDGVLVRDFVPCYRKSDDVIGMYDLVSNSFFTNAGSGAFEKGDDV